MDQRYYNGDEIHARDKVMYAGSPGTVVFVIDRHEYTSEFPEEHWSECGTGFVLQTESMGLLMLDEADEDLLLVSHATNI